MAAYCSNCGSLLPFGSRFCSICGSAVTGFPGPGYVPYAPRLVRPLFGRQVAGVCIGFARTYGWDVGLVRILTVVGAIFLFPVTEIVYAACWIGIPEEPLGEMPIVHPTQPPSQAS